MVMPQPIYRPPSWVEGGRARGLEDPYRSRPPLPLRVGQLGRAIGAKGFGTGARLAVEQVS